MRLVHMSDVHYLARLSVPVGRFLNKRITGWANLKLLRSFQHGSGILERLVGAVKESCPDHVAITGDLTNLSLGVEFAQTRSFVESLGLPPESITIIPGNHDRYTRGADRSNRILAYLGPYMTGDRDAEQPFPAVRVRDGVSLISLDSALSRPPFLAGGKLGSSQVLRLEELLAQGQAGGCFHVVLLHHPPYRWTGKPLAMALRGLRDWRRLLHALESRSGLVLHGHLHRNMYARLATATTDWRIVGVASATRHGRLGPYLLSSFHVIDVGRDGIRSIERWTLDPSGGPHVRTLVSDGDFTRIDQSR